MVAPDDPDEVGAHAWRHLLPQLLLLGEEEEEVVEEVEEEVVEEVEVEVHLIERLPRAFDPLRNHGGHRRDLGLLLTLSLWRAHSRRVDVAVATGIVREIGLHHLARRATTEVSLANCPMST